VNAHDDLAILGLRLQLDGGAGGAMVAGVAEQVREQLLDAAAVPDAGQGVG